MDPCTLVRCATFDDVNVLRAVTGALGLPSRKLSLSVLKGQVDAAPWLAVSPFA